MKKNKRILLIVVSAIYMSIITISFINTDHAMESDMGVQFLTKLLIFQYLINMLWVNSLLTVTKILMKCHPLKVTAK